MGGGKKQQIGEKNSVDLLQQVDYNLMKQIN